MFSCQRPPLLDTLLEVNINTSFLLFLSEALILNYEGVLHHQWWKAIFPQYRRLFWTEHDEESRDQGLSPCSKANTDCLFQVDILLRAETSTACRPIQKWKLIIWNQSAQSDSLLKIIYCFLILLATKSDSKQTQKRRVVWWHL